MVRAPAVARKLAFALTLSAACSSAWASVDLIAVGQLSGNTGDRSKATAAPLENGAPGNLLGGLGSGLAYAGCDHLRRGARPRPERDSYNKAHRRHCVLHQPLSDAEPASGAREERRLL